MSMLIQTALLAVVGCAIHIGGVHLTGMAPVTRFEFWLGMVQGIAFLLFVLPNHEAEREGEG